MSQPEELKMHGGAPAAGADDRCTGYETIPINDYRKPNSKLDEAHTVFWYIRCRVPENVTYNEIRNASNTFFYGENGTISNQPNIATAEYYTGGFNRLGDDHNKEVVDAIVAKFKRGGRSRRRHIRSKTSKKDKKYSIRRKRSLKNKTRKH